jgi:hypothetical protein
MYLRSPGCVRVDLHAPVALLAFTRNLRFGLEQLIQLGQLLCVCVWGGGGSMACCVERVD